ncbi:hypothetical protein Tco_1245169 [Tanacetum coccineum]
MDTESEPFEDPIDTETPESPLTIASTIPLSESTPPVLVPILRRTACMAVCVPHVMSSGLSAGMAEVAAMSESSFHKRFRSSYESSPYVSPPDLPSRKRYRGTSELVEDSDDEEDEEIEESMDYDSMSDYAEAEGPTAEDEDPNAEDKGLTVGVEGPEEEEEEVVPGGQQQASPVVGTTRSVPLGLRYGALRSRELALEEGDVYSTFEVRTGFGLAPESEIPERVSAFRQPTLTTWTDPEDGMIYIDIPDYPPPVRPAQTPPSPEWTSSSLPISPSHSGIPSPISSHMVPLTVPSPVAIPATAETKGFLNELRAQVEIQGGLISDHAVRLEKLSPALFERSLKYEQERVALAEERRARLELAEIVDGMRRGQEPRGAQFCPCVSALRLVARGRADTYTFIRWWRVMYLVYSVSLKCILADRFYHLLGDIVGSFERFWNGLPRMGRAEMVDQARFAWGFLSVFGNANSDRVAITSRTGSYPDTRLRQ